MNKLRLSLIIGATLLVSVALCSTTQAQSRVFVSGVGDDLNPCTRPSPCRNFQRGHDVVAAGGEVVALDSAGYGAVTITKSVTITGDGVMAGITAASGNGITIATAGITVNLRSLSIAGLGTGANGISFTNGAALHIENCIVNRFSTGILVFPSAAGTREVFIKDSISRNNLDSGVSVVGFAGPVVSSVSIDHCRFENNGITGLLVTHANATARNCVATGNAFDGFAVDGVGELNIDASVAAYNGFNGIVAKNGSTVRVSNSISTKNTGIGFFSQGGNTFHVLAGTNVVEGNGTDKSGTITAVGTDTNP